MPTVDRNQRARIMFRAEALDRRTHQPGQHGGCLKHSGLRVLRALLFHFANAVTGRCDPGYDALARAAGVARSTVAVALGRLETAGLIVRTRRQAGAVRFTNAYGFRGSFAARGCFLPKAKTAGRTTGCTPRTRKTTVSLTGLGRAEADHLPARKPVPEIGIRSAGGSPGFLASQNGAGCRNGRISPRPANAPFRFKETAWSGSWPQTTTKPVEQPKSAKTGPASGRVQALLDVLKRRERQLGLAP